MTLMSADAGPALLENLGIFLKEVEEIELKFTAGKPVRLTVTALVEEKHIEFLYHLIEDKTPLKILEKVRQ